MREMAWWEHHHQNSGRNSRGYSGTMDGDPLKAMAKLATNLSSKADVFDMA